MKGEREGKRVYDALSKREAYIYKYIYIYRSSNIELRFSGRPISPLSGLFASYLHGVL